MKRRLARQLRTWAQRLDPVHVPFPVTDREAIVQRQPQSEIRVVHSSIGTQANRGSSRSKKNGWKNRR